jgi:hypothetical protein
MKFMLYGLTLLVCLVAIIVAEIEFIAVRLPLQVIDFSN